MLVLFCHFRFKDFIKGTPIVKGTLGNLEERIVLSSLPLDMLS